MRRAKAYLVILVACTLVGPGAAHANLLTDPSFEMGVDPLPTTLSVLTPVFSPGVWGAELGGEVGPSPYVSPHSGNRMARLFDDQVLYAELLQPVSLAAYGTAIDQGLATANVWGWFNVYVDQPAPVYGLIGLDFYAEQDDWPNAIAASVASFAIPVAQYDWHFFDRIVTIPYGARWAVPYFGFVSSTLPDATPAYIDDAGFVVQIIPEPGIWSLCLAAVFGLVRRR